MRLTSTLILLENYIYEAEMVVSARLLRISNATEVV